MAKARMLHNRISRSGNVNKLSLQAKLLFTWMISHADDEGRLNGDPDLVKGTVVPLMNWSLKAIKDYILEIKNQHLIYYWKEDEEWFIELVNWQRYQSIRADRFKPSTLPSFNKQNDNQSSTIRQLNDDQLTHQYNTTESNKIEENISEYSEENIADKNFPSKEPIQIINPNNFSPATESEYAALETWNQIEPDNPASFRFYLWAAKKGLPIAQFYEFASEIKQDSSIKNRGAVFNNKVKEYLGGSK